jgi:hypothetical protein
MLRLRSAGRCRLHLRLARQRSRVASLVGVLAMTVVLGGCASAPPSPRRDASAPASVHRAIAIVPVSRAAKSDLAGIDRLDHTDYAKAAVQGLGMGAASGWAAGGLLTFALAAGPAGIAAIPLIIAGAATAAVVGGYAQGASAIGPSPQAAALQATMTSAASGTASPIAMATAIADDIARWTPYRAQVFTDAAVAGQPAAYGGGPAASEVFDSVLQVEITQFGFAGRNAGRDIALYMVAEARLLDAGNSQPIALRGLAWLSPWHAADLWTKADGALTRTELKRAQRALAERVVEHMFLDTPWPSQPGVTATVQVCGVLPIASPGAVAVMIPGPQVPVKVDGATPLLAWSAPLAATADAESSVAAASDDLRYDLRIFEEYDWGPGELVYERAGLRGNEHRVESSLKPATMYFWTVRARYAVDGHPHAMRWSATVEPGSLDPLPSQVVYASRFAQGAVTRAACAVPQDFTPCGCLDFIPAANWFRFRTP